MSIRLMPEGFRGKSPRHLQGTCGTLLLIERQCHTLCNWRCNVRFLRGPSVHPPEMPRRLNSKSPRQETRSVVVKLFA